MDEKDYMTIKEASERLVVSKQWVLDLIKRNKLVALQAFGLWLVERESVEARDAEFPPAKV